MLHVCLSGTPVEIGRQRAEKLESSIRLSMEHLLLAHANEFGVKERRAWGRETAKDFERYFPEYVEETKAAAAALEINEDDMLAYNFRVWNALLPHSSHHCYNIGWMSPKDGPIVGGVLEDFPPFYLLEEVHPAKGNAYYTVPLAGTTHAVRGMNEKGLALGSASAFVGTPFKDNPKLKFSTRDYSRAYQVMRKVLQECDTVAEAITLIRQIPCCNTFMLADPSGELVFAGKLVDRMEIRRSSREHRLLIGGSHFLDADLITGLMRDGIHPADARASLERHWQITEYVRRHKKDMGVERMKKMLQTHGGKDILTFCHDGLQCATVAVPRKGEFWVAGYRPCRAGFKRYDMARLSKAD